MRKVSISVVMPCLNEAESIGGCIREAIEGVGKVGRAGRVGGEIIVIDNGSTDGSVNIVKKSRSKSKNIEIRLIVEKERGYGAAVDRGFKEARGEIVVMGDSDGSYDFREISKLVRPVIEGDYDLVWGSRLKGRMEAGAMPWLHRYVGTPLMTFLANLLFGTRLSDNQSGFRALKAVSYKRLGLKMKSWEYTGEMQVKSACYRMRITEVPITFRARGGISKLSPFKAAWNNGKLLLLFSPMWCFALPGIVLAAAGLVFFGMTAFGPFNLGRVVLNLSTLGISGMLIILGVQSVIMGLSGRLANENFFGVIKDDLVTQWLGKFELEKGLVAGLFSLTFGLAAIGWTFVPWIWRGFPPLSELRGILIGGIAVLLGAQIAFGSFFLSSLKKR